MSERVSPPVSLVRADAEDKPVVTNLVQLYLYDMTGDLPFPVGRDGRFEYDFLERFWRHPYVLKAYRGLGIGTWTVEHVLQRHAGRWHIGVIERNTGAGAFWKKALATKGAATFAQDFDGERWLVYDFESAAP